MYESFDALANALVHARPHPSEPGAGCDRAARRMFQISLAYLFSLFLAMNVELIVLG